MLGDLARAGGVRLQIRTGRGTAWLLLPVLQVGPCKGLSGNRESLLVPHQSKGKSHGLGGQREIHVASVRVCVRVCVCVCVCGGGFLSIFQCPSL